MRDEGASRGLPPSHVRIREVRPEEHAAAGEVTIAAYRALLGTQLADWYEGMLRDVASRAADAVVLIAVNGDVLGCVTYVPGPESAYAEELADGDAGIRMLAVAPEVQGRGIGAGLTRSCIERARAEGRRRVVLHTLPAMEAAQRIYRGFGFRREPGLDFRPVPDEALWGFVLDLEG